MQYSVGVTVNLTNLLKKIGSDDSGATAIEYGLIASLVVIASIGAFDSVANENNGIWARVKNDVTSAMSGV